MLQWTFLILVSAAWARKLDRPVDPPFNAAASGGLPGDLEPPLPADHHNSAPPPEVIPIISYDFQPNNGDGSYSFRCNTPTLFLVDKFIRALASMIHIFLVFT